MIALTPGKRCDACRADHFELVAYRDRNEHELLTDICTSCGLVSHHTIPTEAELARFYANDYRYQYHGEVTPSDRRVMRAWNNGRRIYRQLASCIEPASSVFEVGAGIGCTLKVFEQHGHRAEGIDPNVGFQSFSRRLLRASVRRGTLFDLPAEPRHDLVLLVHVIEHFRSPRAALLYIRQILRPGGLLYVECPNLAAPFARPSKMFHYAHVHNFTPWTLVLLAQNCGFQVERFFGDERNPNLQLLLRRCDTIRGSLPDPDGYRRTLAAMRRYNAFTYHARPRYLAARIGKLASYVHEHLAAKRFVRHILAQVESRSPDAAPRRSAGSPDPAALPPPNLKKSLFAVR